MTPTSELDRLFRDIPRPDPLGDEVCDVCHPDGLYDTDGNGPYNCYECGKKAHEYKV